MKIAIVGSGIAGLTCAYLLNRSHEIQVFEAGAWIGGHTHTLDIEHQGERHAIDTGFIVFNEWTYRISSPCSNNWASHSSLPK